MGKGREGVGTGREGGVKGEEGGGRGAVEFTVWNGEGRRGGG